MLLKACGHSISLSALIATFAGWLPPLAAGVTLLWTLMQIIIDWPKFKQAALRLLQKSQ